MRDNSLNELGRLRTNIWHGGAWHAPMGGQYRATVNPGTGKPIVDVAESDAEDVAAAVWSAKAAAADWGGTPPLQRAKALRAIAEIVRKNARELALIDAANCGNPVAAMVGDAEVAAAQLDFFAGLVTEIKGASIPMGRDTVNFSVRQPLSVVARIFAFNHPFMFCAGKMAAPFAAGNTLVVKPPDQAPLSALRLAEMIEGVLPPGVFNVVPGGRETGAALASHPDVAKVAIIGSVAAGRAAMSAASERVKPVLLELGGKNALIAFADADPATVADAMVRGMNFAWCGQSCGSTSRAFLHEAIHDEVLRLALDRIRTLVPGLPTDPATRMGAIVSAAQCDRVLAFIRSAEEEGARLAIGGKRLELAGEAAGGNYVGPTIFADVTPAMRIAREEIFGPVLSVLKWSDELQLLRDVNAVDYGLTCSIWTNDLVTAHQTALAVEAGFVWINEVSKHFLGAPFGGVKQSGIGREECLEELLGFTHEKNIHVNLKRAR